MKTALFGGLVWSNPAMPGHGLNQMVIVIIISTPYNWGLHSYSTSQIEALCPKINRNDSLQFFADHELYICRGTCPQDNQCFFVWYQWEYFLVSFPPIFLSQLLIFLPLFILHAGDHHRALGLELWRLDSLDSSIISNA